MTRDENRDRATPALENDVPHSLGISFRNTYARLPEQFYARVAPTPVRTPRLLKLNTGLARTLGLDPQVLASPQGVEVLAGNRIAKGSEPLAMAYAGHQFGHFVPQLGDGRANLLGEILAPAGTIFDIQLKGSGPTPFSRAGDGRAALGPVLREYLVSEAMAALGVPTTRALAVVSTGEQVLREQALPGAILTRIARSHLRVGTFEYFAARGDKIATRLLADYAIRRYYPHCAESVHPYAALLENVIERQAHLIAQWLLVGFIHGVMNTDNTSIGGETIDYGPCAFLEAYDPDMVFSSIDHRGRYAFSNQPRAAEWNLTRFAEALLPVLVEEQGSEEDAIHAAQSALSMFGVHFATARLSGLRRKLGLLESHDQDAMLADDLLALMHAQRADFTLTFLRLSAAASGPEGDIGVKALFAEPDAFDVWAARWRQRLGGESTSVEERSELMRLSNPAFIPRNHLVQNAIDAAVDNGDLQPFEHLLDVVTHPYDRNPEYEQWSVPARPEQCIRQTFCGT